MKRKRCSAALSETVEGQLSSERQKLALKRVLRSQSDRTVPFAVALQHLKQIYRGTFEAAVEAELEIEHQECMRRLEELDVDRLEAEGVALINLEMEHIEVKGNDHIYDFFKTQGGKLATLPDHNFSKGNLVFVTPAAETPALLVGDAKQLPPTISSQKAKRAGLGVSLSERLQNLHLSPLVLNVQYRMHPAIAAFSSQAFYKNALQSGVSSSDRPPLSGFKWPNRKRPVAFVNISSPELAAGARGVSKSNPAEARILTMMTRQLMAANESLLSGAGIGIITPYAGQVREIKYQLSICGYQPIAAALLNGLLEVKTVDGFQGREKEIILFSAVRCNPQQHVGFLNDARRLNVALTRAKRGLIVLGSRQTLKASPIRKRWLKWVDTQKLAVAANHYGSQAQR
ncbi:hypothetical protein WJX84_002418 [Apatococcus fuscideae]|uniref:DNA2/NAM7 helicase-like C-terminal domain-containing protein n=1 Tax=Apatococcus fuscideae TaxID=2026836 RepID=A0AAW1TC75_9CHLO